MRGLVAAISLSSLFITIQEHDALAARWSFFGKGKEKGKEEGKRGGKEPEHAPAVAPPAKGSAAHGGGEAVVLKATREPPSSGGHGSRDSGTGPAAKEKDKDKDKDKHSEGDKDKGKYKPWKEERPWIPKHEPKVIKATGDFELAKHKIRVSVLGRSSSWDTPIGTERAARAFARVVAQSGAPQATGGGNGIPAEAEQAAFEAGGITWALPPSTSAYEFTGFGHGRTTTVVYPTGTGGDLGSIEREAPLTQITNIRAFFNGGPGTFGELIASLHEPGVLAFQEETGGVAASAREKILPHVGVPSHIRVVSSRSSERLFEKAKTALQELERSGVSTMPTKLYVPRSHQSILKSSDREGRNVMAFLADDDGKTSPADAKAVMKLAHLALSRKMHDKVPLTIVPQATGLPEKIAFHSLNKEGVDTYVVSGDSGSTVTAHPKGESRNASLRVIKTGKGGGVGQFGLHREVVEDAQVIFITSAFYRNLSGLAYAMRQPRDKRPIIAILELESTGSKHIVEMLKVVDRKWSERVITSADPDELITKVEEKLKPKPKEDSKSYKIKYNGDSEGGWRYRVPFPWEGEDEDYEGYWRSSKDGGSKDKGKGKDKGKDKSSKVTELD